MVLRLKFLNGLCMTGGRSLLRPWSPEQPAFSLVSSPVRILGRDAHRGCACPEAAEVTAQFVLEQGEPCVWWHVIVVTLFSAVAKGTALVRRPHFRLRSPARCSWSVCTCPSTWTHDSASAANCWTCMVTTDQHVHGSVS